MFCSKFEYKNEIFAISSEYILLNPDGDLQLITPISSPLKLPTIIYHGTPNSLLSSLKYPTTMHRNPFIMEQINCILFGTNWCRDDRKGGDIRVLLT
jgi:hypothetical protein